MAMKPTFRFTPSRSRIDWYFNNSTVVTNWGGTVPRGGIVCFDSADASGVGLDQTGNKVTYLASISGAVPVGVLTQDVKNLDLTQYELNRYKSEVQNGNKVDIWQECTITTNMIYPGHTPAIGGKAYLGHSGYIATSHIVTDHSDTTGSKKVVGIFDTKKDQDGYATVTISLPNNNL